MTKQKKRITLLPELANVSVLQSNRITNAKYDYTAMQEKIFTWIIYHLQEHIQNLIDGKTFEQLELFQVDKSVIRINMPMNLICRHEQYNQVRNNLKQLASIAIELKDHTHKKTTFTGLFSEIVIDDAAQRTRNIAIVMRKDVAKTLLHIDTNVHGRPMQYTKFTLRVAVTCKNKYTSRIYKLLCSWRERGGWSPTLQELRDLLQFGEKNYPNYSDFKKRVLLPVQKELQEIGDFTFNVSEICKGKKVDQVRFKIIEPVSSEMRNKSIATIHWLMKSQLGCTQKDCDKIAPIFTDQCDFKAITDKLQSIHRYIVENQTKIKHPPAVVVAALIKEFTSG